MKQNFIRIAADFSKIELVKPRKQRIGIVGEIYIKYCHLGNWDMIRFLEKNNCESHTNGLSWYAMYYIDSHLSDVSKIEQVAYRIGLKLFGSLQRSMIAAMRQYGFYSMEEFQIMKKEADGYVNWTYRTGDGWQIAPHRNDLTFEEWMDLDVKYVKERSFWVDWKIIFKTFKVCLLGRGE